MPDPGGGTPTRNRHRHQGRRHGGRRLRYLTKISYWTFSWTTGLGILPMTTLMVFLGSEVHELSIYSWLLVAAAGLVVWLMVNRIIVKRAEFAGPFVERR